MKRLLQIVTTAVVGAVLMGGVAGATGNSQCDIYQNGSTSYNSCQNNTDKTSVQVTCVNNVYVINNNSQNAGTGNATINSNGNGGYVATGNATNENGSNVTIGASCGQATTPASSSSSPSSSSPSCGTAKTCPSSSASTPAKTSVAASSLPETGSNSLVNSAAIATGILVGVLGISFAGGALYRRLALK